MFVLWVGFDTSLRTLTLHVTRISPSSYPSTTWIRHQSSQLAQHLFYVPVTISLMAPLWHFKSSCPLTRWVRWEPDMPGYGAWNSANYELSVIQLEQCTHISVYSVAYTPQLISHTLVISAVISIAHKPKVFVCKDPRHMASPRVNTRHFYTTP